MRWSRRTLAIIGALALAGVVIGLTGAPSASSQVLTVRAVRAPEDPGLNPDWATWAKLPSVDVPITAQNLTYPMGGGSVPFVTLQAVHYNGTVYVRARWRDDTRDAAAVRVNNFSDAVAVMFPARSAVNVPSFCMGQTGSGVNIWQWRADSQDGGPLALTKTARTNGYNDTDSYPDELKGAIYQPARALGNPATMLAATPVQNLVAQAFGTLAPAVDQSVQGNGVWRDGEWSVVFARPFQGADPTQAEFTSDLSTNMAVAVWNGSHGDRAGQKTVSQFATLTLTNAAFHPAQAHDWGTVLWALVIGGGAVLVGIALITFAAVLGVGARTRAR